MDNLKRESKLKRNLGFGDLWAIAIGQIIGAGIMTSTGVAIGMTGTGVVLAFLLSPILTIMTIYPSAVLSSVLPATGGSYKYTSRLIGKNAGLMYLLLHTTAYGVAISQYALSFGIYFNSLLPKIDTYVVSIIILSLFYIMNLKGAKTAAVLNKIITVALFGGIFLFIIFGLPKVDYGYVFNTKNLFSKGTLPFISTLALLSSATAGAQFLGELGGEAKNPGRNIPLAMISSTLVAGVIYVLMSTVAAGVLPIADVANQPLTLVAREIMPHIAFLLFTIGAALGATSSTLNSTLSWVTKPLLAACEDDLLPRKFGKISKSGVPYIILTFFYIAALLPLILKFDISQITKFTTANSLLVKVSICLALFMLASKNGNLLTKSTLNITPSKAKFISILAIFILLVLSYSLFMTLSIGVVIFLLVLATIVLIYSNTAVKNIKIKNDFIENNF